MRYTLLVVFLIHSSACFAQETPKKRFNLKTSIQNYLFRQWNISGEYFLDTSFKRSIVVAPYVTYWNQKGDTLSPISTQRGLGLGLGYRYYFAKSDKSKGKPKGFYINTILQIDYTSIDFIYQTGQATFTDLDGSKQIRRFIAQNLQNITNFQTNFTIGYQWFWWNRIVLDVYSGFAWRMSWSQFPRGEEGGFYHTPQKLTLLPRLGFQIGVAF
jgi:hypothetical protein